MEIYCLTTEDAIKTVADILTIMSQMKVKRKFGEFKTTFEFPTSREELIGVLTSEKDISEKSVNEILELEAAFSLIKKNILIIQIYIITNMRLLVMVLK